MATRSDEYPDCKHADPLQTGAEFLDFVMVTLQTRGLYLQPFTSKKYQYEKGESLQGWEVKFDGRYTDTGQLSIEVAEKTKAANTEWVKSGIYRNDNTLLYIQGNYTGFYIFIRKQLVVLHTIKDDGKWRYTRAEIPTLQKFYLPIITANRLGIRITADGAE